MSPIPLKRYTSIYLFISFIFFFSLYSSAQLTADFTTNKTGGCAPLAISFTNTTTGASAAASYSWVFGNGNTSNISSPGAIYTDEKTYDVTLTVTDGSNTSVKTKQITVYTPPLADFSVSPVKGCMPVTVNFNAATSTEISTYTWDFGDGNTTQDNNAAPSHTYTVPQTASVSLTVGNSYGCTKTLQKDNVIKILPALTASFTASQTTLCRVTDAVQFSNASTGPGTLTYLWNFGDGTSSTLADPSHVFNVRGTYNVTLTVNSSEGCTATNTQNGFINVANFISDFTAPSLICRGSSITFNNISAPTSSAGQWLVDGVDAGYYNYSTMFYSFNTTGTHTVELKNTFGSCVDSVSKTLTINEIPGLQGFIATQASSCGAPEAYNFKDTTQGAVKWEWNFISGYSSNILSTLQAPSYTYLNNGGYYAWLSVTNAIGCTATATQYISITGPYTSINVNGQPSSCGPFSLQYSATSTDSIVTYNWNFGDGATSTLAQPAHLFDKPGNWPVQLTYTTAGSCTATVTNGSVSVYIKPIANFTAPDTIICGNTPVVFQQIVTPGDYLATWNFGDDQGYTESNGSTINHSYLHDSTYSVTLIVYNNGYCQDTLTKQAYIKVLPPFPKITGTTNTCDGTRGMMTFSQQSIKAQSWKWNFGDGSSKSLSVDSPAVSHLYTSTGTYKVVLTNTNGQCTVSDSIYAHVYLKQSPLLSAAGTVDVCTSGMIPVTINNIENNPLHNNNISDYGFQQWQYNDQATYQGYVSQNDYYWTTSFAGSLNNFVNGKTGIRAIMLSTGFNCLDTTNFLPITIHGSQAALTVVTDNVCFKLPVILKDASTTNNKILSWQWNFGDGTSQVTYTSGLVSHIYSSPGNYLVNLTIIDSGNCASSSLYSQNVTVNGPQAAFYTSASNTTITLPVYFYNNTYNYNSNNTQYIWKFGDGTGSSDYSPSHAYSLPGQYTVILIAVNSLTGCADTTAQVITVNNFVPAFTVNSTFLTGSSCPPVMVKMTNNSYNFTAVKWDFGDGTTADNLNYPSHIYEKAGKYIITLFVYGPGGLTGTFKDSVTIKIPDATLAVNKKEGCIGFTPAFTATASNTGTYVWDYGDGTTVTGTSAGSSHQYNQPGMYSPLLLISDSNGCNSFATLTDTINVHPNPTINITPQYPRICKGQPVQITASGGVKYSWSPATGLSNALIANPDANPAITTNYVVTVQDDLGCSSTGAQTITVVQPGKITAVGAAVCLGNTVQLNVTGAASYKWIFNTTGLSNTGIGNPVASPVITTTYTATGTDEYKCFTDTAAVIVTVQPLPTVSIPQVPDALLGTPITLNAVTSTDVTKWNWSPAGDLSCSDCPAPVAKPSGQKTYTLTVTNSNGCTASANILIKLQCQENRVFIPTAFSPNGDGKNDVFSITGISLVKHMVIYNRWGTPVYERSNFLASDRSTGWDGTYKGDPLPPGTYAYFAEMDCPAGGAFNRAGTVILVR